MRLRLAVPAVLVAGLVTYLVSVGLDRADKIGSSVAAVAAVLSLAGPYVLPASRRTSVTAAGSGAVAVGGDNAAEIRTRVDP